MNVRLICILFFFSATLVAKAQINIKGTIVSTGNKAIAEANVILFSNNHQDILAYTITDIEGNFSLKSVTKDSTLLEVSILGFEKQIIVLGPNISKTFVVVMKPAINNLPEVIIKQAPAPITGNKDTISYSVKAFSDSSDRRIIDVIKKLPGISVSETGQILFNNRAINKFYIEGKDLLEDQYAIASNNLPSADVDQVQVLPDHQPIKALKGSIYSNRAAINIKLRKDAKSRIIGMGSVGAGLPLNARNDEVALLQFNKDLQFINTIKTNNTGKNLDPEILEQNKPSGLSDNYSAGTPQLSVLKPDFPQIDQSRFWFNNNNLIASNILIGVSKNLDLKLNIALENDRISSRSLVQTAIYLPADTINLTEHHSSINAYSKLISGIVLEQNTDNLYLRNSLNGYASRETNTDDLLAPASDQQLLQPLFNLVNRLKAIIKTGNSTVDINSMVNYSTQPQSLTIKPGLFADTLNGGYSYDGLSQKVSGKTFSTENDISWLLRLRNFSISTLSGFEVKNDRTSNALFKIKNGMYLIPGADFTDTINRRFSRVFENVGLAFESGNWNGSIDLKSSYNYIENTEKRVDQNDRLLLIDPALTVRYTINAYVENTLSLSRSTSIINNGNSSYVLVDYRDLLSNQQTIDQIKNYAAVYALNYRNIVRGIFANFDLLYVSTANNFLVDYLYAGILTTRNFVAFPNRTESFGASLNGSKYDDVIRTNFNIGVNYTLNRLNELQQNNLYHIIAEVYSVHTRITSSFSPNISVIYNTSLSAFYNSNDAGGKKLIENPILSLKQNLSLKLFLQPCWSIGGNVTQYADFQRSMSKFESYFADFYFQKTLAKPKIDLSVGADNIFDAKTFKSYGYTANIFTMSAYTLRPRSLMFKVNFQF